MLTTEWETKKGRYDVGLGKVSTWRFSGRFPDPKASERQPRQILVQASMEKSPVWVAFRDTKIPTWNDLTNDGERFADGNGDDEEAEAIRNDIDRWNAQGWWPGVRMEERWSIEVYLYREKPSKNVSGWEITENLFHWIFIDGDMEPRLSDQRAPALFEEMKESLKAGRKPRILIDYAQSKVHRADFDDAKEFYREKSPPLKAPRVYGRWARHPQ
jgi:hypothetical protein